MLIVKKMTSEEFNQYSLFSFENYISESAKSSGRDREKLRSEKIHQIPMTHSDKDLWLVVSFNEENVGFVWVQLHPERYEAFGYDIYLEEKFRSRGLGREVMQRCGEIIRQHGIQKIQICVYQDNTIARKLYSSLGFKEINFRDDLRQYTLELSI